MFNFDASNDSVIQDLITLRSFLFDQSIDFSQVSSDYIFELHDSTLRLNIAYQNFLDGVRDL